MVQKSYTKAVENSDMPPPHFNGKLENYAEWVEKLQQWSGVCDPTYTKANEARMILSILPTWLRGSSTLESPSHSRHTYGPQPQRLVGLFATRLP